MSTSRSWPRVTSNCQRTSTGYLSRTVPRRGCGMLRLPDGMAACLFDMDGGVTRTAVVHDAAWKEMFDDFLRQWSAQTGKEFVPFDPVRDYDEYVDGKPRLEG